MRARAGPVGPVGCGHLHLAVAERGARGLPPSSWPADSPGPHVECPESGQAIRGLLGDSVLRAGGDLGAQGGCPEAALGVSDFPEEVLFFDRGCGTSCDQEEVCAWAAGAILERVAASTCWSGRYMCFGSRSKTARACGVCLHGVWISYHRPICAEPRCACVEFSALAQAIPASRQVGIFVGQAAAAAAAGCRFECPVSLVPVGLVAGPQHMPGVGWRVPAR